MESIADFRRVGTVFCAAFGRMRQAGWRVKAGNQQPPWINQERFLSRHRGTKRVFTGRCAAKRGQFRAHTRSLGKGILLGGAVKNRGQGAGSLVIELDFLWRVRPGSLPARPCACPKVFLMRGGSRERPNRRLSVREGRSPGRHLSHAGASASSRTRPDRMRMPSLRTAQALS